MELPSLLIPAEPELSGRVARIAVNTRRNGTGQRYGWPGHLSSALLRRIGERQADVRRWSSIARRPPAGSRASSASTIAACCASTSLVDVLAHDGLAARALAEVRDASPGAPSGSGCRRRRRCPVELDVVLDRRLGIVRASRRSGRSAGAAPRRRGGVRVLGGQLGAADLEHGAHLEHARAGAPVARQREHERLGERGGSRSVTYVPDPAAACSRPVEPRLRMPSRSVERETPSCTASTRSTGRRSPGPRSPRGSARAGRSAATAPRYRTNACSGASHARSPISPRPSPAARGRASRAGSHSDCGIASTSRRIVDHVAVEHRRVGRVELDQVAPRVAHVHLRAAVGELGDLGEGRHVHEDAGLLRPHVELLEVRDGEPDVVVLRRRRLALERCTSRSPARSHSTRKPNSGTGMRSMPRNSV